MDKNVNQVPQTPIPGEEAGRWVPVDRNALGFDVPPLPGGQPVQGPDGSIYCVGNSQSQLQPVMSNAMNAVPTPSSIVQMPPIVQPIALVPYTSQNQPLLQYDPYSRPVDPPPQPKAPVYIRKPYRGLSLVLTVLSLAAAVLMMFLAFIKANEALFRTDSMDYNGISFVIAIGDIFAGAGAAGGYYAGVIENVVDGNVAGMIFAYALPFIALLVLIGFVCLAVKYFVKLVKGRSPRCVSVAAIIEFLLLILFAAGVLIVSNGEAASVGKNVEGFFFAGDPATLMLGIGWLITWILSFVLIIVPLFAKKNAYVVDKSPSDDVHVIE